MSIPAIPATLDALRAPVSALQLYPGNPRQGDVGAIVESLRHHGQYRPIVVNSRTSQVLAGNHTLMAARELGWDEIAVTYVDVDDDQAKRIVLVDNRGSDLATYDDGALVRMLQDLPDFDGTGYDADALDDLLKTLNEPLAEPGKDTEPGEPPADPVTKSGDLIVLGEHRLLCGDAVVLTDIDKLMEGRSADVLVTDPPYGIGWQRGENKARASKAHAGIVGDQDTTARDEVLGLWGDGPAIVFGSLALAPAPRLVQTLIWHKPADSGVVGSVTGFRRDAEAIYLCGQIPHRTVEWSSVLVSETRRELGHPHAKPVDLMVRLIALVDGAVLEPFAGSGTTLIAAENLGRRCYAMEINPGYCDVVVDRWERHTGRTAVRPSLNVE